MSIQLRRIRPRFDLEKSIETETKRPSGREFKLMLDHVTPRKKFDTTGEVDRHNGSRPPPVCEGQPEYQALPEITKARGRKFRLWSKHEIK